MPVMTAHRLDRIVSEIRSVLRRHGLRRDDELAMFGAMVTTLLQEEPDAVMRALQAKLFCHALTESLEH